MKWRISKISANFAVWIPDFITTCTRYGRRWILKGLIGVAADDVLARQQLSKEYRNPVDAFHPGIVGFAGREEVDALGPCIVMEWVDGPTLEAAEKSPSASSMSLT